jgi:CRP-like cAMP-binding protein
VANNENTQPAPAPVTEFAGDGVIIQELSFAATLDWRRLENIQAVRVRQNVVTKPTTVLRQGQIAPAFYSLIDGWGLRYKMLRDGRRQILSFLLPGDPVTLSALSGCPLGYSVQLLSEAVVSEFDIGLMKRHIRENDELRASANCCYERELAMADEHLTNLGRRSAKERIAHLMLEFDAQLHARSAVPGGPILMPLRQRHLADALGLTTIHVNRTLRTLRDEELMDVRGGLLRILDREQLIALAGFDSAYLATGAAGAADE